VVIHTQIHISYKAVSTSSAGHAVTCLL